MSDHGEKSKIKSSRTAKQGRQKWGENKNKGKTNNTDRALQEQSSEDRGERGRKEGREEEREGVRLHFTLVDRRLARLPNQWATPA